MVTPHVGDTTCVALRDEPGKPLERQAEGVNSDDARLGLLVRLMSALAVDVPAELIGGWVGGTYAAVTSVAFVKAAEWDRKSAQHPDESTEVWAVPSSCFRFTEKLRSRGPRDPNRRFYRAQKGEFLGRGGDPVRALGRYDRRRQREGLKVDHVHPHSGGG